MGTAFVFDSGRSRCPSTRLRIAESAAFRGVAGRQLLLHRFYPGRLADRDFRPVHAHSGGRGRRCLLRILLPGRQELRVRGTVVRAYLAPANLRQFIPSGYGIRLKEAPEEYFQLLARLFGLQLLGKKVGRAPAKLAS